MFVRQALEDTCRPLGIKSQGLFKLRILFSMNSLVLDFESYLIVFFLINAVLSPLILIYSSVFVQ